MTSTGRNVGLLAACQAMLFTNNTTLVAINGLAGLALTPVKALATLPVTCWILGGAIATMPASLHMKRVGRQRGLTQGVYWGIAGARSEERRVGKEWGCRGGGVDWEASTRVEV